ncbi:hypothetical protein KIL84_021342 [Mauremys mutica]|uniref:Uncharacterized protein n=1 Tax=Mauremys mutica TaxID=74926 RepID=A0A9D3XYY5_9SAUR|nr:hypothetical protein KIL84_021342 [Mauremys mutica]
MVLCHFQATFSLSWHKQTKAKRQEIIWEWEELPGFVAGLGPEKFLLEELAGTRATVKRRDEGDSKLSGESSLSNERGGEKGQ